MRAELEQLIQEWQFGVTCEETKGVKGDLGALLALNNCIAGLRNVIDSHGMSAAWLMVYGDWQLIETAPKDGTEVLAGYWASGCWWTELVEWSFYATDWVNLEGPSYGVLTHWMPVPEPPVEAKQ